MVILVVRLTARWFGNRPTNDMRPCISRLATPAHFQQTTLGIQTISFPGASAVEAYPDDRQEQDGIGRWHVVGDEFGGGTLGRLRLGHTTRFGRRTQVGAREGCFCDKNGLFKMGDSLGYDALSEWSRHMDRRPSATSQAGYQQTYKLQIRCR